MITTNLLISDGLRCQPVSLSHKNVHELLITENDDAQGTSSFRRVLVNPELYSVLSANAKL